MKIFTWSPLVAYQLHFCKTAGITFLSLIVFGGTEVPIVYILLCRPSEDSLQRSALPDSSPSKDWQSTKGQGGMLDLSPGLQFHILVSLPMSHHCWEKFMLN